MLAEKERVPEAQEENKVLQKKLEQVNCKLKEKERELEIKKTYILVICSSPCQRKKKNLLQERMNLESQEQEERRKPGFCLHLWRKKNQGEPVVKQEEEKLENGDYQHRGYSRLTQFMD
ncbi:lebercilin-like [Dipodomys merriami]|uniref:lebercilin-like n=1 Tax=Dipodomys merriami TaxID=94247 RepID=UPI00385599D4